MVASLSFTDFAGLNIFLVIADVIFKLIEKLIDSFNDNIVFPSLNYFVPKKFWDKFRISIGDGHIHFGKFILDMVKLTTTALVVYLLWRFFGRFEKLKKLK